MRKALATSAFLNVLLFSLFWALQVFVSKLAFNAGAKIVPFTVQSLALCIFLITPYILLSKRHRLKQIPRRVVASLLVASAVHGGLGSFFANAGVSLTTAINAGFLLQFSTVTTTVLARFVLGERMNASKLVTIVTITVGTFLLVTKGHLDSFRGGDALILLACTAWSTGNVLVRKILKDHELDGDVVTFFRPLAGLPVTLVAIMLAPIYPTKLRSTFEVNLFEFNAVGYLLLASAFTVALWLFLNRTLKIASASYMSMMSSLTPVLVAILALVFLHESLAAIQWTGVILIIASGYFTQLLRVDKH